MFVYVGGIPGVGKTTIITLAEKMAQENGLKLEQIAKGVDILCKLAEVATVEELRALPEEIRSKLRPEMNRQLYAIDRKDITTVKIADGHFCFFDVKGKEYGVRSVQPWDKKQMLAMAVITASHKTILKRRIRDFAKRSDRQLDLEFIEIEQKMEIEIAFSQAERLGIPIKILTNEDGRHIRTSKALLAFIKKLSQDTQK